MVRPPKLKKVKEQGVKGKGGVMHIELFLLATLALVVLLYAKGIRPPEDWMAFRADPVHKEIQPLVEKPEEQITDEERLGLLVSHARRCAVCRIKLRLKNCLDISADAPAALKNVQGHLTSDDFWAVRSQGFKLADIPVTPKQKHLVICSRCRGKYKSI